MVSFLLVLDDGLVSAQPRQHGICLVYVSIITVRSEKGFKTSLIENILAAQIKA
jgi:hypothetical protein